MKKLIALLCVTFLATISLYAGGCSKSPCEHVDVKVEVVTASTCTEKGLSKKICKVCGETVDEIETEALGHSFGDWSTETPATCEEKGEEKRTCARGCVEKRDIKALGHNYGAYSVTTPASCKNYGVDTSNCSRGCKTIKYVSKEAHSPNADGICTVCSEKVYSVGLLFGLSTDGTYYDVGIGSATDKDIIIPAEWNGKPVKEIMQDGFNAKNFIETITVPETITKVKVGGFNNCNKLHTVYWNAVNCEDFDQKNWIFLRGSDAVALKVVFGPTVERIPARMFFPLHTNVTAIPELSALEFTNDGNLKEIGEYAFYKTNLVTVKLPDNVEKIGDYAFASSQLEEIELSKNLKSIGNYAFSDNKNLESVDFGNNILTVGDYAFDYCVKLKKADLSGVAQSIGENAFKNCLGLEEIVFSPDIKAIPRRAFYGCTKLTSIVIPDFVESIGEEAFADCFAVTKIILGKGVTAIGDGAFDGLVKVNEINLNSTALETLNGGNKAFRNLGKDTDGVVVTFGKDVTVIPTRLFFATSDVTALPKITEIVINSNVTEICEYAFFGINCTVKYNGTSEQWQNVVKGIGNDCLNGVVIGG